MAEPEQRLDLKYLGEILQELNRRLGKPVKFLGPNGEEWTAEEWINYVRRELRVV